MIKFEALEMFLGVIPTRYGFVTLAEPDNLADARRAMLAMIPDAARSPADKVNVRLEHRKDGCRFFVMEIDIGQPHPRCFYLLEWPDDAFAAWSGWQGDMPAF
jgi:hypothetical protein